MSQIVTTDVTISEIKGDITCSPICHFVYQYIGYLVNWLGKGGQKRSDQGYFF